ncbi:MAG: FtsX-like permease family protein [Chloroflexi bacterium]|nr:FtsX-like permease family protein [Ardenticatenaceae bacterium]MBL1128561.1 ABC transporter permease [Chloroflexota bacterium]NOG34640.1 FtsX-like permease family protein [Chloroflexota bacterium]
MSFLYRTRAIFTITFKRLWAQRGLTAVTLIGLTIAVALITTVPLYADAVNFRMLQERLSNQSQRGGRPPFAYLYNYIGAWYGAVAWETIQPLDDYLQNRAAPALGLPEEIVIRHLETDRYRLYPADTESYAEDRALGIFHLATTQQVEEAIEIVDGRFPQYTADGPIEILVAEAAANQLGIQAGDQFIAYNFRNPTAPHRDLPLTVAGVWRPKDERDPFWFFAPSVFDDLLLVAEEIFPDRLAPLLDDEIHLATWYLVLDGSRVSTGDVNELIARAQQVERQVNNLLPETSNPLTPADPMLSYQRAVGQLTVLLTAYNIPIIFLILAFIALIVNLAVDQRRNEIAVMRSRGATPWQVVGFAILEGVLLGLIAWALGTLLGLGFTQLMGRARSFMDFTADTGLRVAINDTGLRAGAIAIALALLAQVLPTISASRDTIITYKQGQARSAGKPWYQRIWLDLLLLIPTVYGFYLLQQQGSLITIDEGAATDPFANPLLFLLPALAVFAFTLFSLRVLPWLMEALSWLLFRTNSVGLLMAARHLARTPRAYATPLILLVLTVSLSVFTASLALTLDFQLYDDYLYRTGADLNLEGPGREYGASSNFANLPGSRPPPSRAIYLPLSEYLDFPGVEAAAPVGTYAAAARVGNGNINGTFYGIDRTTFPAVSFWRYDFAPYRLGALVNLLAASPDGVLVANRFLAETGLRVGDFVRLDVRLGEANVQLNAQILGAFDYFPTWYPESGPLFVGNLDNLFALAGSDFPYRVWMRTSPDFDEEAFRGALRERQLIQWRWQEPYAGIRQEQTRPERQGLFGLLSVGFLAAALLTVMGFFMYALYSFRRRFIELGILRAVGLSQAQMLVFVACEMGFLILTGLGLGILLGSWVSQLFIPFLQIGAEASDLTPPYLVEIAWTAVSQIAVLFGLLFLAAMLALGILLRRMKIFQAVKLGETA